MESPTTDDPRVELARDRTGMANYRTQLAMDRTMLAWIRTTLTIASFGFALIAFFRSMDPQATTWGPDVRPNAIRLGALLVALGTGSMLVAGWLHWQALCRLRKGMTPELKSWSLSVALAVAASAIGLVAMWLILKDL